MASKQELQVLVKQLSDAVDKYDERDGKGQYLERAAVREQARRITNAATAGNEVAMMHSLYMTELVALKTFADLDILQLIPSEGSISLPDLAKAANFQQSLLERMCRVLVGTGFLDQDEKYHYRHTLISKSYLSTPGPVNFFQLMFDEYLVPMSDMPAYLAMRANGGVLTEPDDLTLNPYSFWHKQDGKTVWEILGQFPQRQKNFQLGLMSQLDPAPVVGAYDFGALYQGEKDDERVILVDMGGGQGQSLAQILKAYPNIPSSRVVLQDLPMAIDQCKETNALPADSIKMVHDFWTPQPIKRAKAYFMRRIMHDYSDSGCVKILTHLKDVMAPDSRVLIADVVLPPRVSEAELGAAMMDNAVMMMGGKERTEQGYKKILEEAGLKLVQVWGRRTDGGGLGGLVEAELAG